MSSADLAKRLMAAVPSNPNISILEHSEFLNCVDETPTPVPALNIMLSGRADGGLQSGITVFAAPSKHYKSNLGLVCVGSYLRKNKDAVCLFFDSEFGASMRYFQSFGIDTSRVIHVPIDNVETLKFNIVKFLTEVKRGEKVIILIDSIGNLASLKELEDAQNEKSAADMTRAKQLKSVFRMITPMLSMKDLPLVAINHVYQEIGSMYPKTIMGGGTGPLFSAQNVIFATRAQDKEDGELQGYVFTLIAEKSRAVKEQSKIGLEVSFKGGINKFSGLFDLAVEFGLVAAPKKGWYTRTCVEGDKNWRKADTHSIEFWAPVFKNSNFKDAIEQKFRLPASETTNIFEDEPLEIEG